MLSVAVSHDGQWIVSGSKDRGVQFWEQRTAQVQLMLQGHKNSGRSTRLQVLVMLSQRIMSQSYLLILVQLEAYLLQVVVIGRLDYVRFFKVHLPVIVDRKALMIMELRDRSSLMVSILYASLYKAVNGWRKNMLVYVRSRR